jgi:Uma2 family endonuclease
MTELISKPEPVDDGPEPERLVDLLELLEAYKAELLEGAIIVTSLPDEEHAEFLVAINHQLCLHGWYCSWRLGVITPLGRVIPGLTVAPRAYFHRGTGECWQPAEGVAMVVEVTSSYAFNDWDPKRRGYAAAGIPLYLFVDRKRKETVLFSKPEDDDYTASDWRPIHEPIPLPEPFSFTLEGFTA